MCFILMDKPGLVSACHSVCVFVYVCVLVCVRAYVRAGVVCVCVGGMYIIIYSYCLIGDNGRLQYLRFCLLKFMLMWFLS